MGFSSEQAQKIVNYLAKSVQSVDVPMVITIATDKDFITVCNGKVRKLNPNERNGIIVGMTSCAIKNLTTPAL